MVLNLRSISNYQFIFGIIRRETQLVIQSIWGRKNSSNGINGDWRFSLITYVLFGDLFLNLILQIEIGNKYMVRAIPPLSHLPAQ